MLAAFGTGSPIPTPVQTVPDELVTPGPVGFLAVAVIAVAVVLLVIDMVRRVRRTRYRAEIAEVLDAEQAAAGDSTLDGKTTPDEPGDSATRT